MESEPFDTVISRVGLIYFPDQQKALQGMKQHLKPGCKVAAMVYSTADKNGFSSVPVSIIRHCANLPAPLPGQAGPFSLDGEWVLANAFQENGILYHDIDPARTVIAKRALDVTDHYSRPDIFQLHVN